MLVDISETEIFKTGKKEGKNHFQIEINTFCFATLVSHTLLKKYLYKESRVDFRLRLAHHISFTVRNYLRPEC